MSLKDVKIVVDIGGTNARFGLAIDGALQEDSVRKYAALDFNSLEGALNAYCAEVGVESVSALLIATAARHDVEQNTWNFINDHDDGLHSWVIDPVTLKAAGYPVYFVLNDFEAATWGLSVLSEGHQGFLRSATSTSPDYPKILTGPGTGLGLAYLDKTETGGLHVRDTFGAHMLAAAATDEHFQVIQHVSEGKGQFKAVVWEDLLSGAGLYNIYAAHCRIHDKPQTHSDKTALFNNLADPDLKETLRLFHELLGSYLSTAVVFGHSLGGIYLTSGVTDTLVSRGLFDLDSVLTYLKPDVVPPVAKALSEVRVVHVTDEFIPLRGLVVAEENDVPRISYD